MGDHLDTIGVGSIVEYNDTKDRNPNRSFTAVVLAIHADGAIDVRVSRGTAAKDTVHKNVNRAFLKHPLGKYKRK